MTAREIITAIVEALQADAELNDWCTRRYGRAVSVTVGWGKGNVPEDDWTYPAVSLALWKVSDGEGQRMAEMELDIETAVYPPESTSRTEGALLADDLLCLCRDAIARATVGTEISAEIIGGMTEFAPRYVARGTLTIKGLRSHRAGLGR